MRPVLVNTACTACGRLLSSYYVAVGTGCFVTKKVQVTSQWDGFAFEKVPSNYWYYVGVKCNEFALINMNGFNDVTDIINQL